MTNAVMQVIEKTGLDEEKAKFVIAQFSQFQAIASEWDEKAKTIVVTDESQTELMETARKGRLYLKSQRTQLEKVRKELKASALKEGQAIDGIARELKALIEPAEQHLLAQENFVEIRETARKDELEAKRRAICEEIGLDPAFYALRDMPDEDFDRVVESHKEAERLKEAEAKRLEWERVNKEDAEVAENERIRKDNDRLLAEKTKKDAELAEERKKAWVAEEEARKERHEKDLALQREKYAKETKAEQKAEVLSLEDQLIIARKAITNISQSGNPGGCKFCEDIEKIANKAIHQIGGWLE